MHDNKGLSSNHEAALCSFKELEDETYNKLYELSGFDRNLIGGVHVDGYNPTSDLDGISIRYAVLSVSIDMAMAMAERDNLWNDRYEEEFAKLRENLDSFASDFIKEPTI